MNPSQRDEDDDETPATKIIGDCSPETDADLVSSVNICAFKPLATSPETTGKALSWEAVDKTTPMSVARTQLKKRNHQSINLITKYNNEH